MKDAVNASSNPVAGLPNRSANNGGVPPLIATVCLQNEAFQVLLFEHEFLIAPDDPLYQIVVINSSEHEWNSELAEKLQVAEMTTANLALAFEIIANLLCADDPAAICEGIALARQHMGGTDAIDLDRLPEAVAAVRSPSEAATCDE